MFKCNKFVFDFKRKLRKLIKMTSPIITIFACEKKKKLYL